MRGEVLLRASTNRSSLDHEYLPIDGHKPFVREARKLLFGTESAALKADRVASVQSLSGTGRFVFFPRSKCYSTR